jgi:peptide deformylase
MAVLPIITDASAPVLHEKTKPLKRVTKETLALIKDMEDTVRAADGLGLAAPQVGKSVRLCLARIGGRMTPLIDPQITWRSKETDVAEEGCLSLPGKWCDVRRPVAIVLTYLNARGQEQERKLDGIDARVVQHEVDHLDGILITDYVGDALRRRTIQQPA